MKIQSNRNIVSGHIIVPGSKSHTIRALILAAMADGVSHIKNPLPSNDCLSTVEAVSQIGADVDTQSSGGSVWTVTGAGRNLHLPDDVVNVGNSGSLMYFLCPVLATLPGWCVFTGDESIRTRPVTHLVDSLNQLGAGAFSVNKSGTPPFVFRGPLDVSKKLVTDGKLSQYISGFMMAASRLDGRLEIELTDPKETPYLTMTKLWLDSVGVKSGISDDFRHIHVDGPVQIKGFDCTVPSDWEAVAFPLVAALVSGGNVVVDNVDFSGSQGDSMIVDVLVSAGADIVLDGKNSSLTAKGGKRLSAAHLPEKTLAVDISAFPDAICALAAAASYIEGNVVISDVEICRKKETDRVKAMVSELGKLGADIHEDGDSLVIHGHSPVLEDGSPNPEFVLHGGSVESYKDHRIAMSLACFGLGLPEGESVVINDAESCSVSFPHFFEVMNGIGAGFSQVQA